MKEAYNWKSIVAGLSIIIVGIILCIVSAYVQLPWNSICSGIGCSLIASAFVIILKDLLVVRVKENPLDVWGIKRIYQSRTKMNDDCGVSLKKARYRIDIIAFGLKSYRTDQEKLTKSLLQNGVDFRIITMNPTSPYVSQRELEENENNGQIKNTIDQLIVWANKLNTQGYKGRITVKGYSCMTLDFYWRVDDEVYVGPYWYGLDSQQTISYKFCEGKGFKMYSDYFDKLWNNSDLLTTLTSEIKVQKRRKR